MRSRLPPRAALVAVAVAVAMLAALPQRARAASANDYDQGVSLLGAGRWDEARQAFERAVASKPTSSAKRDGYFPYYQLGVAWQRLLPVARSTSGARRSSRARSRRARRSATCAHASGCKQLLAQLDQLAARIAQGASELQPLVNQLEQRAASARSPAARDIPAAHNLSPAALRGEFAGMGAQAKSAADSEGRQKLQDLDARVTALRRDVPAAIQAIADADVDASAHAADAARRAAAERAARPAPAAAPATPPPTSSRR